MSWLLSALAETGYVEGWNLAIEFRFAHRDIDTAFVRFVQKRADALMVGPDSLFPGSGRTGHRHA